VEQQETYFIANPVSHTPGEYEKLKRFKKSRIFEPKNAASRCQKAIILFSFN